MNWFRAGLCIVASSALMCGGTANGETVGSIEPKPVMNRVSVSVPVEFRMEMEQREARKFNANDIRSFVFRIFSMYDHSTGEKHRISVQAFHNLIAEDVHIEFPDYKISKWTDFVTWHGWIHGQLVGDYHKVGPIDVEYYDDGTYHVHLWVRWQALFKSGLFSDVCVAQDWEVQEQPDSDQPVLKKVVARVAPENSCVR